jgi:hypothetical protein
MKCQDVWTADVNQTSVDVQNVMPRGRLSAFRVLVWVASGLLGVLVWGRFRATAVLVWGLFGALGVLVSGSGGLVGCNRLVQHVGCSAGVEQIWIGERCRGGGRVAVGPCRQREVLLPTGCAGQHPCGN